MDTIQSSSSRPGTRTSASGRWLAAAATLFVLVAGLPIMSAAPALADVIDIPIPDNNGCVDSDAAAVGMYETPVTVPPSITLEAEGPVLQVIVEWQGIWDDPPIDPELDIEVTGPGGADSGTTTAIVAAQDNTGLDASDPMWAMGYYDDITDLFGTGDAGSYTVEITPPPDTQGPPENHWWGAVVTIVYDTTPCGDIAQMIWKTGADYYFGGDPNTAVTSETIAYQFDAPLTSDYTATLRTSHAGADSLTGECRVSILWVASGTGTAPAITDPLVNDDGTPAYPGAVEGIVDPFTPPSQPCAPPIINPPIESLSGGHVGPQYALLEFEVTIPAGVDWFAFQLESPQDGNGEAGQPEAGSWAGGGLLILSAAAQDPAVALEKTVLDGNGAACPGVEGTDELVTGLVNTPVTYCFRVINTGDSDLFPVTLDDPDLGITHDDMTLVSGDDTVPLEIGEEQVYSYDAVIGDDLLNLATVTGIPVDFAGNPLPDTEPLTDSNDAAVELLRPEIVFETTVVDGAGADCPGVEGTDELVTGPIGAPVAYCFLVLNTGDIPLFPVTIDDPDLGITEADMTLVSGDPTVPLAPGGEIAWSYATTIAEDLVNTATATGTPVDESGEPLDIDDIIDDNDAEVALAVLDVPLLVPVCENDTPYLLYEIDAMGLRTDATITFSGDGESHSVLVPVGRGEVLWPGAAVDADGNPTDWPGWDLDAEGNWFLDPANPFLWAREAVEVTVEVNPTFGPVIVGYPPPTRLCTAGPPIPPPAELPRTGAEIGSEMILGVVLLGLGIGLVTLAAQSGRRTRQD